ncbi:VOC family protein [Aquipuribacter sp. SD81]|uniref:VOC family protein n=1 Tax=Aquipuribacter sp. SD81 TaxID=3127703 RepID=UPI0030185F03
MPRTVPCLWFDGQAEAAAAHYVSIFPNSEVTSVQRAPADTPSGPAGYVMVVEFTLDGQPYTGLNGGPQFTFSEAVSFQVMCEDQAEADHYWDRLSEGGEEGPCGWLKDRFGLSWQVVPKEAVALMADADPERARRATEAMLGMTRLDVAAMRAAADGAPVG